MCYADIAKAIRVVTEFEGYVEEVQGHDDEEYARYKKER